IPTYAYYYFLSIAFSTSSICLIAVVVEPLEKYQSFGSNSYTLLCLIASTSLMTSLLNAFLAVDLSATACQRSISNIISGFYYATYSFISFCPYIFSFISLSVGILSILLIILLT